MRKIWHTLYDIIDDVLAYVLTIVGIVFSSYIPLLRSGGFMTVEIDIWRIVLSSIVALIVISKQEVITTQVPESRTKAREGRRRRFVLRMANALSTGIAWAQLMSIV